MENVTRRILNHLDIDTRRKLGLFGRVRLPNIRVCLPKRYEDSYLFYTDIMMWDTRYHVMIYKFNSDRYTEYDYRTHEIVEFVLHRSFHVSRHPDYI